MLAAFTTGFTLAMSLILAIGAQNAFVLRQGLMRSHVLPVVLFCALSDAVLILLGVGGVSLFVAEFAKRYESILFGLAALWLFAYGLLRLRDAIKGNDGQDLDEMQSQALWPTMAMIAALTFLNPHVYLDTVVLIGVVSARFEAEYRAFFALGACVSSFVFFFSLGFGARLLAPLMQKPNAWRILDFIIAGVMFVLSFAMLRAGGVI